MFTSLAMSCTLCFTIYAGVTLSLSTSEFVKSERQAVSCLLAFYAVQGRVIPRGQQRGSGLTVQYRFAEAVSSRA